MAVCSECGAESPVGFRFCGSCGAPLADGLGADVRKTVTVVFCDLVGSTALGERSDPEVLRTVMRGYHAELRAILEHHGGTVEKFVGDAAMAVFGIPRVHEDDPLRAVRAAVEMREAVASLGLEVRIGVNTGEVVAGSGEALVTGDAVNVAARLEQAASTGEILIGAATERFVRGAVVAAPVEPLELKGKSEPVPAFRLLKLTADVPAFTAAISAPFVGREQELASLERAFEAAVGRRAPQLATIVGEPGIGKSRLARELLSRCAARVLVGRCLSYGEGITYWPLAEIASQIGDLRGALHGATDSDLALERIDAALGSEAAASSEEIAWGFRRLLETVAGDTPLIVVFDDIQWAEPTLLDLIEYLAAFAQDAPLLLLCMARPQLFELRPGWSTPRGNALLLILEPLGGTEAELLVEELGDLPAQAQARIVAAAEGNPLFVEQLVALQAESATVELEIPATLQALLAARIDALSADERAVVERGSVEGRLFHRGAVAELLPQPARQHVGTELLALVRKELIRPDRATLPGDDAFRFGHILIRDAAYEAMPKRQRGELHERFADWLVARLGEGAPPEIVGYHLEQAYCYCEELGTSDPALGARASEQLAAAARGAQGRQDIGAAVNLFGRAVRLVPDPGAQRRSLLVELGTAFYQAGELAQAEETLDEAVAHARQDGDARIEWRARVELAYVRLRREPEGAIDSALGEAESAIASLPDDDDATLARAWRLVAHCRLRRLELDENARAFEEALRHARHAGDQVLEAEILALSVPPPLIYGPVPVEEGLRYVDEILERMGDVESVRDLGLHLLGHLRARAADFDGALAAFSEWRERLRERGKELAYASSAGCLWEVYSLADDWSAAEPMLREAFDILERMGERFALAGTAVLLGDVAYRERRLGEAERYIAMSTELGGNHDPGFDALSRLLLAKVLAARGESEQAESLAQAAVEIVDGSELLDIRADIWLGLAEVLRETGRAGSEEAARQALALYEQKGHVVGVAKAKAILDIGGLQP
ncbi:MAG: hypothetical protein E6G50_13995 [Actinobacteria bacterium]|nr:MAG: hypothetical protein E6G50_13995 [Actinomycetota bacterium]